MQWWQIRVTYMYGICPWQFKAETSWHFSRGVVGAIYSQKWNIVSIALQMQPKIILVQSAPLNTITHAHNQFLIIKYTHDVKS